LTEVVQYERTRHEGIRAEWFGREWFPNFLSSLDTFVPCEGSRIGRWMIQITRFPDGGHVRQEEDEAASADIVETGVIAQHTQSGFVSLSLSLNSTTS